MSPHVESFYAGKITKVILPAALGVSKLVKQQQQIFLKQEKNNKTKLKIIYDLDKAVFLHDLQSYSYLYN